MARFFRAGRIFYGWWVVLAGAVINGLGGSLHFYGFTVFFLPLSRDLNLNRAATSLVFSLSRAEGAFEGPLAGYFIDRFGPRLALLGSITLTGLGYMLLSQVNSYLWFLLVYIGLISVGFNAGFLHAVLAAVNNWFIRRRALVMAIILSAFGLGGAIVTPLLSVAVSGLGWRQAAILAGAAILVVSLPCALVVKRSPESLGLLPDGDAASEDTPNPTAVEGPSVRPALQHDFTVGEALRTSSFWVLTLATAMRIAAYGSSVVHFVPIMVWKGMTQEGGAFLLGLLALFSVPIRLFMGWFGDRWYKPRVISLGMFLGLVSLPILLFSSQPWHLWIFAPLFAFMEGMSPLNWATVGDFFGRRHFATVRGTMGLVHSWGMIVLPVLAGAIYDRTESYEPVLWTFAGVFGLASLAFFLLRRPQSPLKLAG